MKNTQSEIKPIKIGKRPGTTCCFGCKDYTQNCRPEKKKITNKVLWEKSNCVVCWSNKSRFKKIIIITTDVIKIRWRLTGWSVEEILTILTQKCLEQKITD